MKEFFCRVLRYSFCWLLLGFLSTAKVYSGAIASGSENAQVEHKAPRVDTSGNALVASIPVTSPEVASVQAAVTQVQSEVVVLKQEVNQLSSSDTKIDACCFTMNGKLDALLIDSQSILDNLNVSVNLSTVESKLDTLIDASSVMESMLENLNITIDVSTLESKLDACCYTMNDKLDALLMDSQSILDNLNVSVNLSTVESKLDTLINSSSAIESMLDDLNVTIDISTLESKLDACCVTTQGKLDALLVESQSILDNLNVSVNLSTVESKLDTLIDSSSVIESMLDDLNLTIDISTLESKVDHLLDDISTVESLIVESDACTAQPLTNLDVSSNRIVINMPGNYCMAHDIGTLSSQVTVSLVADNITLCLNNRELIGTIEVYGAHAQIKNGTLSVSAGTAGVTIAPTADHAQLSHLSILCDMSGAGTALLIEAPHCSIVSSVCAAGGSGGDALAIFAGNSLLQDLQVSSYSQGGGHGIACYSPASYVAIKKCIIDGRDSLLVSGLGSGIFIASGCSSIEIRECTLARTANFAIEDNHEDNVNSYSSVIYNNFAYDSANSSATYQIRNKRSMGQSYGVDLVSGTPGLYSNVYVP